MSHDANHPMDELSALVERGLARYLPILPVRARSHFRGGAMFLLETHPAAFRWLESLRAAGDSAALSATVPEGVSEEVVAGVAAQLGLRPRSIAEQEDLADIVLHEAEGGLRFLVEATFPERSTVDACGSELRRFVDLALASMFAGLCAALFRRHNARPEDAGRLGTQFFLVVALFRRFDLSARDAATFEHYFMRPGSARAIAKSRKITLAEEEGHVFRFLEELVAFVEEEGPVVERELKADRMKLTRDSAPWANDILTRELLSRPRRSRRRRPS